MTLDRIRFFAFVASGAIWIIVASLGLGAPVLGLIAAAYVLPSSLALALARERTGMMLAVLWGCAVALMAVVTFTADAGVSAIVVGLVYGTICFVAWMSTGFLLLHFFTADRPTP